MNLRKLAKGRDCTIRIPGHCLNDNDTVVLCHIRMAGVTGMHLKSNDIHGAYGCFACHQIVDGQRNSEFTFEERRLFLLEGMVRTQAILLSEGRIKV
jgi:hypothetical protein